MSVDAVPPPSGADLSAGGDLTRQLLGLIGNAVVVVNASGVVALWNAAAERILRRTAGQCLGRSLRDLGLEPLQGMVETVLGAKVVAEEGDLRLAIPDAACAHVLVQASRMGPEEAPTGVVLAIADVGHVSDAQRVESERLAALVQYSADVVALVGADGTLQFCAPAAAQRAGFSVDELIGRDCFDLVHPEDQARVRESITGISAADGATCDLLFRFLNKSGDYLWMQGRAVNLLERPSVGAVLVSAHDVSAHIATETQLAHEATHDQLTGLPNRTLFVDRLHHYVEHARRHGHLVAVLFWDLDNFKTVNDLGGHVVGDSVLVEMARHALDATRAEDTVARLGGDEFVACAEVDDEAQALALAERLLDHLPVDVALGSGRRLLVTSSIGVACGVGVSADTLLVEADQAMYDAKHRGGRAIVLHSV